MTSETEQVIAFLRARIAEDEAAAKAASRGPWTVNDESYPDYVSDADHNQIIAGGRWGGEGSVFDTEADALHVVRHDPARVLREVAAKRAILDWYEPGEHPSMPLYALAEAYADHPDYDEGWRLP